MGEIQARSFYKQVERWRNQPIEGEFPYVFLDGGSGVFFHPV
jgi:transposase-like protein